MHLIEIPDIKFKTEIPSEIGELTADQFVHFVGQSLKLMQKQIGLNELKISMAAKFLNLRKTGYSYLPASKQLLIAENMQRIADLLDYFFVDDGQGNLTYNLSFANNMVPYLRPGLLQKLRGPADGLADLTFLEYKDANTAFNAFRNSQDPEELDHLVAILYRPGLWRKQAYKPERTNQLTRRTAKLPPASKWAVYLFFAACEDYLRSGTITIDGHDIDLSLLYTETMREKQKVKKPKYESNTGLAGVALALAATGVFGPIEKVYGQNLYDVILLLYKQRIEYLNMLET